MPYIEKGSRELLLSGTATPLTAGELNFMITTLADNYVMSHGKSYKTINEVVGALECAKLELYRRIAAPYEDVKISENSDVYKSTSL